MTKTLLFQVLMLTFPGLAPGFAQAGLAKSWTGDLFAF